MIEGPDMLRCMDIYTGRVLWEADLPAGGYATPAVYAVDGKQYIVTSAGGVVMVFGL